MLTILPFIVLALVISAMETNLWQEGIRFFGKNQPEFVSRCVEPLIREVLRITDANFMAECVPIVMEWIIKKQSVVLNNKKSPFRENLKKCEWKGSV